MRHRQRPAGAARAPRRARPSGEEVENGHAQGDAVAHLVEDHAGAPVGEIVDPTGCGDAFRAGLLYGINPLDQPSVEIGKRLAIDHLRGTPR